MERLTEWYDDGQHKGILVKEYPTENSPKTLYQKFGERNDYFDCEEGYLGMEKLKQYEDTDLTPEQIAELDKLYLAKCEEVNLLRAELAELKKSPQGDLISRSAVMELIESKCTDGCLGTEDTTLIDAHGLIDDVSDLPTAYDLEKVVEQLEEYAKSSICYSHDGCPYRDDDSIKCENCGALGALEIVRAGGKE